MEYEVTLAEEEIALRSLPEAALIFMHPDLQRLYGGPTPEKWLDVYGECLAIPPEEFDKYNLHVVMTNICFEMTVSRNVQPIYHAGSGKSFHVISGPPNRTIKISRMSGQWCAYLVYTPELFEFFKRGPIASNGEVLEFMIVWYKVPKVLLLPFTNVPLFLARKSKEKRCQEKKNCRNIPERILQRRSLARGCSRK